jgi:CubicO group peptidase (beta-lactamase class C family)
MKLNKQIVLLLIFVSCIIFPCKMNFSNDRQKNLKLVGCWKGGILKNNSLVESNIQLRLLSLKPDSTLALTVIYELSPRSRVWEYETEIKYEGDTLFWLAHQGFLSENGDTMHITKNWKGEETHWRFYRDRSSDQFMNQLITSKKSEYTYKIPEERSDDWICSDMNDDGIDEMKIVQLINHIKNGKHKDIHSILIFKNGKLVLEEYFGLKGKLSGPFVNNVFRDKVHNLASTTKGIFSALCGIAIDKGLIGDVNEPIYKYLPEYANLFTPEKKQIMIKDMLTMKAGWEWEQFKYPWSDPRNNAAEMYKCGDVIKYVLERPLAAEPGKKFKYTNGEPTVLGAVLKNASGMEVNTFAEERLFNPLGITEYIWTRYPDGSLETDGGLALCSRDLAKIGQLFLNNGKWDGDQIISENWIKESIIPRVNLSRNRSFGYYWNEMKYDFDGEEEKAFFVPGDGGQFLVVLPSLKMVIVFTAGNYGVNPTTIYWNLIKNEILPAIQIK